MSRSAPSTDEIDLSWRMRDREARQLAELMRKSRLTLLHSEPGVGRTELLTGGLLPLLRRRASDAVGDEDRESRVVIPFSDRRTRRAGRPSTRVAERVVFFDGWGAGPLAALRAAVVASLPDDASTYARSSRLAPMLGELSRRFDAHFLIILDSFERFWHPALSVDEADDFVDQLSDAVEANELRAHFLVSVDDLADPRLDALRQRMDGFDQSALHLLRWDSRATIAPAVTDAAVLPVPQVPPVPPVLPVLPVLREALPIPPTVAHSPAAVPRDKPRRAKLPRPPAVKPEPIRTEAVYAFIESTLTHTTSDFAPWHDGRSPAAGSSGDGSVVPAPRPPPDVRRPDDRLEDLAARITDPRDARGSRRMRDGHDSRDREGKSRTGRPNSKDSSTDGRTIDGAAMGRAAPPERPGPLDKWLGSVSDWMRLRLRKR